MKNLKEIFHYQDGIKVDGVHSKITGDVSNIWGDVTDIKGDVSNISGNVSNIRGNVTDIEGDVTGLEGNADDLNKSKEKDNSNHKERKEIFKKLLKINYGFNPNVDWLGLIDDLHKNIKQEIDQEKIMNDHNEQGKFGNPKINEI
jgi:uncharacterized protein YjbJ (UPF0337 family)